MSFFHNKVLARGLNFSLCKILYTAMCVQKDTVSDLKLVFLFVFTLKSVLFWQPNLVQCLCPFDQLISFTLRQLISWWSSGWASWSADELRLWQLICWLSLGCDSWPADDLKVETADDLQADTAYQQLIFRLQQLISWLVKVAGRDSEKEQR